jgi:hypothetical protein
MINDFQHLKIGELYFYFRMLGGHEKRLKRNFYRVESETKFACGLYVSYDFFDPLMAIGPIKRKRVTTTAWYYCFLYKTDLITLNTVDLLYLHEYNENIRNTFLQNYL